MSFDGEGVFTGNCIRLLLSGRKKGKALLPLHGAHRKRRKKFTHTYWGKAEWGEKFWKGKKEETPKDWLFGPIVGTKEDTQIKKKNCAMDYNAEYFLRREMSTKDPKGLGDRQ